MQVMWLSFFVNRLPVYVTPLEIPELTVSPVLLWTKATRCLVLPKASLVAQSAFYPLPRGFRA